MRTIAIDFETRYDSKIGYSLTRLIAEKYCQHPLFDPYLIAACDGECTWVGHPRDFNWNALEGVRVVAHNMGFDYQVWLELQRLGQAPKVNFVDINCTANLAAYVCNRRSLAESVEYLYKVKLSKEMRGNADGKGWGDFSTADREKMREYARRDAFWCWKLWNDYSPRWPAHEQRLSWMTIQQGIRGIYIDVPLLDQYLMDAHDARRATEKIIPWIADADDESWEDFNARPTSTKCTAEQCRRSGIPCPPVKSDDPEAFAVWEETYRHAHPWIEALTSWRSLNKLYRTCETVKSRLRPDNTMPFETKFFGAHTGRWAGGARFNVQNLRRTPVIIRTDGLMEQDDAQAGKFIEVQRTTGQWPAEVRSTIDLRHLLLPRPGKKMVTSDLSQIEPRVLAWLAGDTATLELLRGGMSIYEIHARLTMGWTGGVLEVEDHKLYTLAKARCLGLGYGCGWRKFIVVARNMAGIDITKDDPEWAEEQDRFTGELHKVPGYGAGSRAIVKAYRDSNPKIVALWRQLDDALKMSIGEEFRMQLPSGRTMRYPDVRYSMTIETDPETKKPRRVNKVSADIGGMRCNLYGGLLVENLVQATARDVFAYHLLKLEDAGLPVLFTAHDEAVLEVDKDVKASDVAAVMSETPPWLLGCPIAAKAKEVAHYKK